jgi:hypothetical protein
MNKTAVIFLIIALLAGCKSKQNSTGRIQLAKVGNVVLYQDELPQLIQPGINETDSAEIIQNYVNKWAKRRLLLQKAMDNLSPVQKKVIEQQTEDTRTNLLIYNYQQQMIFEKMDTVISESELENYYNTNEKSFILNSNIIKALFIKLPVETPDLNKIRKLTRSSEQKDLQQLETYCYQFAEKFDDFNEEWVPMNRLTVELQQGVENEEDFLKRNRFFETSDSLSVYLISVRDYRLRSSIAPYEYVKDDIKRIIWNTRRIEFIQSLENGIFNDELKKNSFKIY